MNKTEITAFMSQSKNIEDWNLRREEVHNKCKTVSREAYRIAIATTDCEGLVVKVLGKSPRPEVKPKPFNK